MNVAIQVLWWIGLAVALGLTLIILKQVFLIVGTLRDIDVLASHTRAAAVQAAENVEATETLDGIHEALASLAGELESVSDTASALSSVTRSLGPHS